MYQKKERKKNRWADFNYNSPGFYFVTICTEKSKLFFGKIENDEMILNKFGQVAYDYWRDIPSHYSGVKLGGFVVMPNHLHGIIIIEEKIANPLVGNRHACSSIATPDILSCNVVRLSVGGIDLPFGGNRHACSVHCDPCDFSDLCNGNYLLPGDGRQYQKLPNIIGSYKSSVSREIKKLGINIKFGWHKSYYDNIIRNENAYYNILEYIKSNPAKWHRDRNNIF